MITKELKKLFPLRSLELILTVLFLSGIPGLSCRQILQEEWKSAFPNLLGSDYTIIWDILRFFLISIFPIDYSPGKFQKII
jgi:hypothetical protein